MSDGGPPDQGLLRLPQSYSTGDCDGHLDKRLCGWEYAKGKTAGRRQRREKVAREGQSSPIDGVVREVRATTEEPEIIRGLRSGSSGSGT